MKAKITLDTVCQALVKCQLDMVTHIYNPTLRRLRQEVSLGYRVPCMLRNGSVGNSVCCQD